MGLRRRACSRAARAVQWTWSAAPMKGAAARSRPVPSAPSRAWAWTSSQSSVAPASRSEPLPAGTAPAQVCGQAARQVPAIPVPATRRGAPGAAWPRRGDGPAFGRRQGRRGQRPPGGLLALRQGGGEVQEVRPGCGPGPTRAGAGRARRRARARASEARDLARSGLDLAGLEDGGRHGGSGMSPVSGCRVLPCSDAGQPSP